MSKNGLHHRLYQITHDRLDRELSEGPVVLEIGNDDYLVRIRKEFLMSIFCQYPVAPKRTHPKALKYDNELLQIIKREKNNE